VTVVLDKERPYRPRVDVLERPSAEGYELVGQHEVLLPLLHAAVACGGAVRSEQPILQEQAA
jgi:hypothetical protein